MAETSDVAIIGGGAVGSSIAYFLASNPDFRGRVTVVERDPTYRFASSALSLSSEERRVGKECATLCRSRWSPYH